MLAQITPTISLKSSKYLRTERLRVPSQRIPIVVAALWPKNGLNLGTLGRTVDAVGAWMVTPSSSLASKAIRRGNTIGGCIPWETIDEDPYEWLAKHNCRKVAVELAHNSTPISELNVYSGDTILVIGNELHGIPNAALELCDEAVEIPMSGVGNSLNVTVAASIVLYKLAGLT